MELCEKMLEYIKCATGLDLWNHVKKMLEFIKCATGPDLWNYVNVLRKKLLFLNIKSATGPDLWNYGQKCWNI